MANTHTHTHREVAAPVQVGEAKLSVIPVWQLFGLLELQLLDPSPRGRQVVVRFQGDLHSFILLLCWFRFGLLQLQLSFVAANCLPGWAIVGSKVWQREPEEQQQQSVLLSHLVGENHLLLDVENPLL